MTTELLTAQGRELLDLLRGEDIGPQRALQLASSLRGRFPPDLVAAALTQQALRAAARVKFSRAEQMLFTRAGLEQASSELTASHAAARYPGGALVADLCCGIGGNLIALAAAPPGELASDGPAPPGRAAWPRRVLAADRDLVSLQFARHNAAVYGAAADAVAFTCADVREITLAGVDGVFIDPARRAGSRRLAAGRSEPPLLWCLDLAGQVPAVGIKAAPGLPRELVPAGWEAEFVAIGRDLKEALLWSPALATARTRATILPSGDTLTAQAATDAPGPVAGPGAYLLDPSPAVTRAGLVQDLGRRLGAWQIDPAIAFLSADRELRTPFARTLRVLESAPWHERNFARRLAELGIGAADIRRRGLAGDVDRIHRRLGLRGPGRATIVITRSRGRPWGLICSDIAESG